MRRICTVMAVMVLLILTAVPTADAMADEPSEYLSYDALYSYSTWGSGTEEAPYGSTVEGISEASGTVFIQSAVEGYPVRTIESVGDCKADVLVIPETVETLGNDAFAGSDVKGLVFLGDCPEGPVPEDLRVSVLEGSSGWDGRETVPLETYSGGDCSFAYFCLDSEITVHRWLLGADVEIPGTIGGRPVTRVGDMSFMDSPVTSASMPETIMEVGVRSFYGCTELVSAPLPGSMEVVGDEAFRFCTLLGSAELRNTWFVGFEAFRQCYAVPEIYIPDSVTRMGEGAFYLCRGAESVHVGKGIDMIPARTFGYADSLQSVEFSTPPKAIGQSAFYNGLSLTSVDCSNAETIGEHAFRGCKYLTDPRHLDSAVAICDGAFADCRSLKEVFLGEGLSVLGARSFDGCRSLEDLYFEGDMPEIGSGAVPDGTVVHCFSDRSGTWSEYNGELVVDVRETEEDEDFPWSYAILAAVLSVILITIIMHRRKT